jgi:hypothetical protein
MRGQNFGNVAGTVGAIGSGILDAVDTPNDLGFQGKGTVIGKSALSLAGTGAMVGGPIGAAIGGVVGAGIGLISANKQRKLANAIRTNAQIARYSQEQDLSSKRIASDPSLIEGNENAMSYKHGGPLYQKFKEGGDTKKAAAKAAPRKVDKIPDGYELEGEEEGRKIYRKTTAQKQEAKTAKVIPVKPKTTTAAPAKSKIYSQGQRPKPKPKPVANAGAGMDEMIDRVYMEDTPPPQPKINKFDPWEYVAGYQGHSSLVPSGGEGEGRQGMTTVWNTQASGSNATGGGGAFQNGAAGENYMVFGMGEQEMIKKGVNSVTPGKTDWIDRSKPIYAFGQGEKPLPDLNRSWKDRHDPKGEGLLPYYNMLDGTADGMNKFLGTIASNPELAKTYGVKSFMGAPTVTDKQDAAYYSGENEANKVYQSTGPQQYGKTYTPNLSWEEKEGSYIPYVDGKPVDGQTFKDKNEVQKYLFNYKPAVKSASVNESQVTRPVMRTGGDVKAPLMDMYMQGGNARQLSSTASEMVGPSHESGGIKVPELGAELEGGESTNGSYVFSKSLGFAQKHIPLARAIGKIEKKPMTTERRNSLKLLKGRESALAEQQESLKKYYGIK